MQEIYQGPMPHPDTLKGFGEIDLSFPERIMKMAEAHNDADVKTKLRLSLANLMIPIIGQVFTLLITGGGIIACVFLAIAGKYGESVAAIILSFAPIIINALTNLKNKQR
jgi:uncharacterized membrane protein